MQPPQGSDRSVPGNTEFMRSARRQILAELQRERIKRSAAVEMRLAGDPTDPRDRIHSHFPGRRRRRTPRTTRRQAGTKGARALARSPIP